MKESSNIYEIKVKGNLGSRWSGWFDGWELSSRDDGTTILMGEVVDQAALYGLLAKIQSLNLTLISVKKCDNGGRNEKT
jgi:hypothetical protein